ncbi:hypothetical protein SAMD00019534_041750, partial [Acytostelium subglobosum LB1]|uniref:hypothetical protein n=1 Tax=Acytostelium subglobosum LB1 TaxID=1410327 RepID=UPI000644DC49
MMIQDGPERDIILVDEYQHLSNQRSVNDLMLIHSDDSLEDGYKKKKDSNPERTTPCYMLWVLMVCSALASVQFVYSIQFALGTPLFKQKFKLTPSTITLIQSTCGPISGFLVQPIIGVYSDNSTFRLGRRRPYIIIGALCCMIGQMLIAYSPVLGQLLGDNENGVAPSDYKAGIAIAITGFWIMNLAVNTMQGPCRSLISDIIPEDKQTLGNAFAVITMGLASVAASLIGARYSTEEHSYRDLFTIGTVFTGVMVIPTLIAAKEEQALDVDRISSPFVVFKKIVGGFRSMNGQMIWICSVFFLSWFGYSPFMVSMTNYFGENVSPNNYQQGVQLGFYANACLSASSLIFSFLVPLIVKYTGERFVYMFTHQLAGVAFILFLVFDKPAVWLAILLTSLVGPSFTTFNSIPYSLMSSHCPKREAGLYMGVLNSAAVVSQTISIMTSGQVEGAFHQDSAYAIAYGGLFTIICSVACWGLPTASIKDEQVEFEQGEDDEDQPLMA